MSLKSPKFGDVAIGDLVRVLVWLPNDGRAGACTSHRSHVTHVTQREFQVGCPAGVRFTKTYGLEVGADLSGKKTFHEVTEIVRRGETRANAMTQRREDAEEKQG